MLSRCSTKMSATINQDADSQMELPPEDVRRVHGEYITCPHLPSLGTLNPAITTKNVRHVHAEYLTYPHLPSLGTLNPAITTESIVTRGSYQETDWPNNSSGAVPEEAAAAAAPEVVISAREQRCAPDAAAGASVVDRSNTPLMKGPPLRSVTFAPSPSSNNHIPTGCLNGSLSAPSQLTQCEESTINLLEDIDIFNDLIPEQYNVQYDIALLYAEDDLDEAMSLRTLIEEFGITDTDERPRVCTIDYNPDMIEGSKIKHVEDAMRISTMVFLFITKKFCQDRWAELQKDECLMTWVNDPEKQWRIMMVLTQKKDEQDITKAYKIPFGLQGAKTINIFKITQGESLANLNLTEEYIMKQDKHFLKFLKEMLSTLLTIRKARVANDREKLIKDLKMQLALKQAESLAKEGRFCECKKNEAWEQQLKQRVKTGDIAESPHSTISSGPRGPSHRGVAAPVESGPSYRHHLYGAEVASIPAMPPYNKTTVNVSRCNIVQVGDCNTATALNADEEGDIYVPDNDVPLRRHVTNGNAPRVTQTSAAADTAGKQTQGRYSDSDSEDDLYQSQISNKEALFCQEEYARQPMMEQAKSIGLEFDEIESTQAEEEASLQLKHLGNPGSVPHKDVRGSNYSYTGCNTEDTDTRVDALRSLSISHNNKVSHKEDLPCISEWIIGPVYESVTQGTNTCSDNAVVSLQPGVSGAGSNNDSQKLSVTEKFGQNHSNELADSNVNSNPDTMDLSGCNNVSEKPEMYCVELPSSLRSICYAYPHHIDRSYSLGRSILTSIKAEENRHQEDDEDLD